ncbi:MAG TPA: SRPBCC family protein [Chloroflexota bacterium]|nr:SRPBCC family protein [Chloroflexota bacterium]
MRVEASIVFAAGVDQVSAFIAAPRNGPRWQERAVATRLTTPGPVRVRTEMEHVGRWVGMRIPTRAMVTVFEPAAFGCGITTAMSPACAQMRGCADARMRYALEPTAAGTKLTLSNEFALPVFTAPLAPLLRRSVQFMFDRDVARLRDAIEAENEAHEQEAYRQPPGSPSGTLLGATARLFRDTTPVTAGQLR